MRIKNEMERVVREEVARQEGSDDVSSWLLWLPDGAVSFLRDWLGRGKSKPVVACRCVLCVTDTIALALTSLPPCYCRSHHYGMSIERIDSTNVHRKVETAQRRIKVRPRHSSSAPVHGANEVRLVDFGLAEGRRIIDVLLKKIPGACSCPACREDTLAFALNRAVPRYGVSLSGRLRMPPHHLDFLRHELIGGLSEAAKAIAQNPRHDDK